MQGAVRSQLNWESLAEDTFQTLLHSTFSVERGKSLSPPCQADCLLLPLKAVSGAAGIVMQENYVVWIAQPPWMECSIFRHMRMPCLVPVQAQTRLLSLQPTRACWLPASGQIRPQGGSGGRIMSSMPH